MASAVVLLVAVAAPVAAAPFDWVDSNGFHSVPRLSDVPLAHRKSLPMVKNRTALPFTEKENRDGAMYVWFIFGVSGFDYPYTRAADIPKSPFFSKVEQPESANIAWWKGFVALYDSRKRILTSARGEVSLRAMEKKRGKAAWYRFNGPPPSLAKPPAEAALQSVLSSADRLLALLDPAAIYPMEVKDPAELERLKGEYRKAVDALEGWRKRYPDDPQLLRRLGVCYRRGYNLGIAGAWDRAEAYLLRTEELSPDAPEPYISLGILYADTDNSYGALAESQFRTALRHARKEQLPQIWWGIALSLHYQGKKKEALAAVDRVIAMHPEDLSARKLRERIVAGEKEEGGKR